MSDLSGDDLAASILAEASGTADVAPKKTSKMPTIIAVVVLTVVAIGGGAGVGMLIGQPAAPEARQVAEAPAE
ncbi:MAG: hypothetical protein H7Y08_11450, partial [Rhizobiaceae bacterium]|nr:hypothetical protein [Rhizobiaceae bacterium]